VATNIDDKKLSLAQRNALRSVFAWTQSPGERPIQQLENDYGIMTI